MGKKKKEIDDEIMQGIGTGGLSSRPILIAIIQIPRKASRHKRESDERCRRWILQLRGSVAK